MAIINDTRNKENTNLAQLPRKIDKSTLAQMTLGYAHHEVHDGKHFFWFEGQNIADINNYLYFYIQTADSANLAHILIAFSANGYCRVDFGTWTLTEADVNLNFPNNRFPSANTSETLHSGLVANAPTGFSALPGLSEILGRDGTPPTSGRAAFGASSGGDREEFILTANSKYVMRLQALMADVDVNVEIELYEHADKY